MRAEAKKPIKSRKTGAKLYASPVGVPMVYINQNKAYDEVVLLNKCNQLPFYVLSDSRQFESFYQKDLNNFFDIPYGVI